MKSPLFDTIKRYYDLGLYNNTRGDQMYVGNFVKAKMLTETEYKTITGEEYVA